MNRFSKPICEHEIHFIEAYVLAAKSGAIEVFNPNDPSGGNNNPNNPNDPNGNNNNLLIDVSIRGANGNIAHSTINHEVVFDVLHHYPMTMSVMDENGGYIVYNHIVPNSYAVPKLTISGNADTGALSLVCHTLGYYTVRFSSPGYKDADFIVNVIN